MHMPGRRARKGKLSRHVFQAPVPPAQPQAKKRATVWPEAMKSFRALFALAGDSRLRETERALYHAFKGIHGLAFSANRTMTDVVLRRRLPEMVRAGPFSRDMLFAHANLASFQDIRVQAREMGHILAETRVLPLGIQWKPEWEGRKPDVASHLERAVAGAQDAYLDTLWRWVVTGRHGDRPQAPDYTVIIPLALA